MSPVSLVFHTIVPLIDLNKATILTGTLPWSPAGAIYGAAKSPTPMRGSQSLRVRSHTRGLKARKLKKKEEAEIKKECPPSLGYDLGLLDPNPKPKSY